jgi:hypothetical protein
MLTKINHTEKIQLRIVYYVKEEVVKIDLNNWLYASRAWAFPWSQLANWRSRKVDVLLQSKSECCKSGELMMRILIPKLAVQNQELNSKGQKGWRPPSMDSDHLSSLLLSLFALFSPSIDWMRPTHILEGSLFYSVKWLNAISSRNTLIDTHTMVFDIWLWPCHADTKWMITLPSVTYAQYAIL